MARAIRSSTQRGQIVIGEIYLSCQASIPNDVQIALMARAKLAAERPSTGEVS
jgi:hypothetical protein